MKKKKGVFFSLTIVIVGLLLLTLVVVIHHKNLEEQSSISRAVLFNRMQDEVTYVSRELISILNIFNITVSVYNNTVSVTENLPFPDVGRFQTSMQNWKTFTESNSDFNLTVDVAEISNTLPLIINDQVQYKHTNGVSGVKITVENASLVASYSVFILAKVNGSVTFDWETIQAGNQNFTLKVQSNTNTNTTSKLLNFSKGSDLNVNIGSNKIDIGIGKGADPGFFKVDDEDQLNLTLTTNITLNTTGEVKVSLPNSIINITSNQYNISRLTTVVVAQS